MRVGGPWPAPSFVHGREGLCWVRRRMRPANKQGSQQRGKQTTAVTSLAAQSMADTNASGCYSRLLREANTWKNQQYRRVAARASVRHSGRPRHVSLANCLLLGTLEGVRARCRCRGYARRGACGLGTNVRRAVFLRLQRLGLAIFSRPKGRGVPGRGLLASAGDHTSTARAPARGSSAPHGGSSPLTARDRRSRRALFRRSASAAGSRRCSCGRRGWRARSPEPGRGTARRRRTPCTPGPCWRCRP